MFDKFKAEHGGLGPLQSLLDLATHGTLSNRLRVEAISGQMDDTLGAIRKDPLLSDDFKGRAAELLRHGVYDVDTAIKNIGGLQAEAQTQRTIAGTFAPVLESAQSLYDKATNPADQQILSTLLANGEAAHKLALDPSTRQTGMQMLGTFAQDVSQFTAKNKEAEIAAQTRADEAARDLDKTQNERFQKTQANWQRESATYQQTKSAWSTVLDLAKLKEPNAATDQNLMRAAAMILNPNVQTRPGEDPGDAYYDAIPFGLGAAIKYATTNGTGLSPSDRATLIYAAGERVKSENAAQMDRNTRALAEGRAADLPSKYLNLLSAPPIDLGAYGEAREPVAAPAPKPGPTSANDTAPPDSTATMVGSALKDTAIDIYSNIVDFSDAALGGIGSKTAKKVRDYQKKLRSTPPAAGRTDEYGEQVSSTETGGSF